MWLGRDVYSDWVDRANGFWTVLLLSLCSLGAFLARYLTTPIVCFNPAQFTRDQSNFALQTCFYSNNTYHLPIVSNIPTREEEVPYAYSYHVWIPLILFFQALCFKIPSFIWAAGKSCLALNMDATMKTFEQGRVSNPEHRKAALFDTARVIGKTLEEGKVLLTIVYLVVKLLYCINLLGQFLFLTVFFHNSLLVSGLSYVNINVVPYIRPLLAKTIMCSLRIRRMADVDNYTVQCDLVINEVYEKMFVCLWYWVFFLALVTVLNLFLWAGSLFLPFLRDRRISTYIRASRDDQDSSSITRFISGFLGSDGVLLMSMISQNSSEMMSAELSQQLYQVFLQQKRPAPVTSSPAPQMGPIASASGTSPIATTEEVPLEHLHDGGSTEKSQLV